MSRHQVGEVDFATGQVTIAAAVITLIVEPRSNRRSLLIVQHGTNAVYLGEDDVTTTTGVLLPGAVGAAISIPTTDKVYGTAAAEQVVSYIEIF